MSRTTRLDQYLATDLEEALWFARPNSFAWLTGGDNVVSRSAPVGVAAAGYDGERVVIVTDTIEAPRLRAEELDGLDALDVEVVVETFPWYESSLAATVAERSPTPAAADFDVPGFDTVDASELRQPLTEADAATYRSLGGDVAAAVESVCRGIEPQSTEREVSADLQCALARRGCTTPVALVGGEERAPAYRHYTPTDAELGDYALVSVTAERDGLSSSLTRTVAFDPPDWLAARDDAAARVEVSALAATRRVGESGGTAGDVFETIRETYDAVGFEGEWRHHHQGGAAGFAGREWFGSPGNDAPVELPMGYAWNPTVQGAKSEGTHLVTSEGVETLTATGDWPTEPVESVDGGLTLERPVPLSL